MKQLGSGAIGVCALVALGLLFATPANAAEERQPQLPDPQWTGRPHSRDPSPKQETANTGKTVSILPANAATFDERCAQPGVVLCDPLDEGRARGVGITSKTPNATLPQALNGRYRDWRWCIHVTGVSPITPVFDHQVKTSGSGALKFVIPNRSAAEAAGYCQINFTPDNSVQFGEGETFFVQFRVRMSCTLIFIDCDPGGPGYKTRRRIYRHIDGGATRFKVSIINAGDDSRLPFPVNSCTAQHVVLKGPGGIVAGYHSCDWYDGHEVLVGHQAGSELWDKQPKKAAESGEPCVYRVGSESLLDCVTWPADEWVTVTQQVTIGKWTSDLRDPARSSNIRIWVQREGESPKLVIDYDRNLNAPEKPFMKYGKIWLLPYMTQKDPREEHPEAYMWFDELIVSRDPIAPAK